MHFAILLLIYTGLNTAAVFFEALKTIIKYANEELVVIRLSQSLILIAGFIEQKFSITQNFVQNGKHSKSRHRLSYTKMVLRFDSPSIYVIFKVST